MAGLCEGSNEPSGFLKAICKFKSPRIPKGGGHYDPFLRTYYADPQTRRIPDSHRLTTLRFAAYPGLEEETPHVPRPALSVHHQLESGECYGMMTEWKNVYGIMIETGSTSIFKGVGLLLLVVVSSKPVPTSGFGVLIV
ncbi:hypothetical protein ANN_25302 [Periplaneta americana]|uniref:Uncharacterized protein n=1 Tax=Periplaneta americana TaxID=6978 RepID=A0ABQ8S172_PERAM|nr:hypothetical protein ANN_25302 [Periplaneta americana]